MTIDGLVIGKLYLLNLQLDIAAPALAALTVPIVIAKVNADKYTRLGSKYDVEYDHCTIFLCYIFLFPLECYVIIEFS